MSAIEVLKDLKRQYSDYCNEYQLEDDNKFIDALDEALLALEQKENDRKQGALETYKNVLDKANRTIWDNNDWQLYTRRKIKELEGVEK